MSCAHGDTNLGRLVSGVKILGTSDVSWDVGRGVWIIIKKLIT
jgi:hypothetical protein